MLWYDENFAKQYGSLEGILERGNFPGCLGGTSVIEDPQGGIRVIIPIFF